jgi:hypothetical protein
MDREELLALDMEALVDLIVRLFEQVTELEARVRRPPKGHQGLSRRRAVPDVVVRCRPTACQGCGAALVEAGQRRVRHSQFVELPELRPVVIEAWVYAARRASCGERTIGEASVGLEAARTFGPRVEALLGYLHYGHHLSHERLVAVCGSVFGLRIGVGARAAPRLQPGVASASRARPGHTGDLRQPAGPDRAGGRPADLRLPDRRRRGVAAPEAVQPSSRDELFVCLHREDVEPTNNSSERDLRNIVIHDKVTGGYRSRRGAEQGAIFATLLTTARKLGQNAFARLCSIAGPSSLRVAGLA